MSGETGVAWVGFLLVHVIVSGGEADVSDRTATRSSDAGEGIKALRTSGVVLGAASEASL